MKTASSGSNSAPTIIFRSLSIRGNWWPASAPSCGGLSSADPGGRLEINGIAIDPGTREVMREGAGVEVTTFEFDILETLMRSAGRVVSRDELMEELYGRKATPFDRSVDMHISHLRKKLEGDKPLIKTVRGVGYQFVRSPEENVAA